MSDEYQELIADMAHGGRRRGVKKGAKRKRITVRRCTIEFTQEMSDVIDRNMYQKHQKFVWETIYEALELLAAQNKTAE